MKFTQSDRLDLMSAVAGSAGYSSRKRAVMIDNVVALIRQRNPSAFLDDASLAHRRFYDEPPGYVVCHGFYRAHDAVRRPFSMTARVTPEDVHPFVSVME